MNRSELRTAIRLRTGMLTDDQMGTDTNLNSLITDAINYLTIEAPAGWPWQVYYGSFDTVAGTETYTFATIDATNTLLRIATLIMDIDGGHEVELSQQGPSDLRTYMARTPQGSPECWAVDGATVLLRPVPSAVYTIRFKGYKAEPTLSGDSASPLMPSVFHNAIVEQAAYLWYRRVGNMDAASIAKAETTHLVQKMQAYSRQSGGPSRIRDVRERQGGQW